MQAPPRGSLRPRTGRVARLRACAPLRRDRCRDASGAAQPLRAQRRRDRPARVTEDGDIYEHAAELFAAWREEGALVADDEEALWAIEQTYTGPDGMRRTRTGFLARIAVTDYGPGGVRPHERTQPGPKEDRLRLTRATEHNLSPIFVLSTGDAMAPPEPRARRRALGRGERRRRHRQPDLAGHRPGGPRPGRRALADSEL